ncbi:MAG TPA: Hsp33 family molecular chaperone HslO [Candidatus Rubrimentiphilum sp.]|nr:Hsp33 family molecular chaperone HslO [Candidatus Rubrimentiphilum sp.]
MRDAIVTASAPEAGFAITAAVTTGLVRETQRRHGLSPTATAAAGRLITGAALLGAGLKDTLRISLQAAGDGPLQRVAAEAWLTASGRIGARAYVRAPYADLPLNAAGKFDVGGAIGSGSLHVTKAYEEGQPYMGVVPLQSGEIAEDLAFYLLKSEQIPSAVALGVLADPSGVVAAGGVIAQVLPDADERAIAMLERRALDLPPVTTLISNGADAHELIKRFAGDEAVRSERVIEVGFACLCTRERVETALAGLGADELLKMSRERRQTDATCEFCKSVYVFSSAELADLVTLLKKA